MTIAYLSLGSNLNNPLQQLNTAITAINLLPTTKVLQQSNFYWTSFIGAENQPDVLNAVVEINTELSAYDLLKHLLAIELAQGRDRKDYGARSLDLDLLLYGDEIIQTTELIVPHPRILQRAFVLFPLAEIAKDLRLPNGEPIQNYLADLIWDGKAAS